MPQGRPPAPLTITDEQQEQLDGVARSDTLPCAWVVRARMIPACAEGLTNKAVAVQDSTRQILAALNVGGG